MPIQWYQWYISVYTGINSSVKAKMSWIVLVHFMIFHVNSRTNLYLTSSSDSMVLPGYIIPTKAGWRDGWRAWGDGTTDARPVQIAMVFLKEYLNQGSWSGICETGLETIPLENDAWHIMVSHWSRHPMLFAARVTLQGHD